VVQERGERGSPVTTMSTSRLPHAVAADAVCVRRALPHGHAAAVLGTMRAIGLDRLLGQPADQRLAALALALIASRLIAPASKLATTRDLAADTAASSLAQLPQFRFGHQ
jgi:hypothetical protein